MPTLNETPFLDALIFQDWGLIDYQTALLKQLELVEKVADQNHAGYLIFCTHPPVVTTGRATRESDIFAWQGQVVDVSRGGRATYHGPSQVIVYPIINLRFARHERKEKEIVGFLRDFENAIVKTLKHYGIQAQGRSLQKNVDSEGDETGVWVQNKKIASLGIAVKKWVTYHGAAINFSNDETAFQGINPCGFSTDVMTSVEVLCLKSPGIEEFKKILSEHLIRDL